MKESLHKMIGEAIPTQVTEADFNEYFLPHLSMPQRGPKCKIGYGKIFNYILKVLYTGCQWKMIEIEKDLEGKAIIHYTQIYRNFARWSKDGSIEQAFLASVGKLF